MRFLVRASGKINNVCEKSYVINAPSVVEAEEIAKDSFSDAYAVVEEQINTDIKKYSMTVPTILSIVFMLIAIGLSFIDWKVGHDTISIAPRMDSMIYSVFLYSAFVVRFKGIHRTVGSMRDLIVSIIVIFLFSSFIQVISLNKTISFGDKDLFTIDTKAVFPIVTMISWLGLKMVSAAGMCLIALGAVFNITQLSRSMRIWGAVYVVCAYIGLLCLICTEPVLEDSCRSMMKYIHNKSAELKNEKNVLQFTKKINSNNHKLGIANVDKEEIR